MKGGCWASKAFKGLASPLSSLLRIATWQVPLLLRLQRSQPLEMEDSKAANTSDLIVNAEESRTDAGNLSDELLLRAQGHHGELPRQFSSFAALSLAFVITNSWLGYCASFAVPLLAGGGPTVFWGVIVAAMACLIISELILDICLSCFHLLYHVSWPTAYKSYHSRWTG